MTVWGKHRFILEYHYLGDIITRKSKFVCTTLIEAINQALHSENWKPIVFDKIIEEDK